MIKNAYREKYELILLECGSVLSAVNTEETKNFIRQLLKAKKIFVTGVGRVLLILECFAKRLRHLGLDAYVVGQITEPAAEPGDILIVASSSGETILPLAIAEKARSIGMDIIWLGSNGKSHMAELANSSVHFCVEESVQPMKSLFEQSLLIYCDAVAMLIIQELNITENLWRFHANLE